LASGAPSVVMFMGPHAYISPNWYPGKAAHGKVVPTWNYVAVHAHGTARAVDDRDWLRDMLRRLTAANESVQPTPWRVEDAPADFIDKLMRAIVGIEIPIERLEGRNKASQDEDLQDRVGTVQGLRDSGSEQATAVAARVEYAIRAQVPK
jgi:transcriptional regulator